MIETAGSSRYAIEVHAHSPYDPSAHMQWQSNQQPGSMYAALGQQQAYPSYHNSNTNPQRQPPSQPYPMTSDPAQSSMPNNTPDAQIIGGEAEGIRYEILYRDVNSIVRCRLQPNSSINITAGVMAGMSANLRLEGKVKLKNMFMPGKTFSSCVTAPNGPGELILAPPMMADVMPLHLGGGNEWIVGESCFLGYTPGVQKSMRTQGLGKAIFSGEGLFVTKLSGTGVAFITSLGAIHGIQLQAGEEYIIDNDHLVAWNASMTYKVENMGSFMTAMVSSEGKVCRFSGPGTVYMQTRNPSALAAYMRSIGVGKAQ